MKHKVKVTVIKKECYADIQQEYCANPCAGPCSCYNVGDEFVFERGDGNDHFWHMGLNTLTKTTADPDTVAGGPKIPFCSEAWDAIARYIYTGLQGGSIMQGWMKEENTMITCCNKPLQLPFRGRGRAGSSRLLRTAYSRTLCLLCPKAGYLVHILA